MRRFLPALLLLLLLLDPSLGRATDDTAVAAETFRAGEQAYGRGDYRAAAKSFEVSHRLVPHASALYNAGLAWQAAGEPARAADALAGALGLEGLDEAQQQDAGQRLAELRKSLATVEIDAPPGSAVWLAQAAEAAAPAVIHVPPGEHEVKLKLPSGKEEITSVKAVAGQRHTLSFEDQSKHRKQKKPPPAPPDEAPGSATLAVLGWVGLATAVAAGGAAIGLGLAALEARDEFDASGHRDRDAHDRAATLRTATNIAWVAAGALAVTGVVLLIVSSGDDDGSAPAVEAQLLLAPTAVQLSASF